MQHAAFIGIELPLWFVVAFLALIFAPSAIGGAILGAALRRLRGHGSWLIDPIVGALAACIAAAAGARLLFGGYRGTVGSDDLFWSSVAVGVACALAGLALIAWRRPGRPAARPEDRTPPA